MSRRRGSCPSLGGSTDEGPSPICRQPTEMTCGLRQNEGSVRVRASGRREWRLGTSRLRRFVGSTAGRRSARPRTARPAPPPTLRGMDRRSALVLLIVFGTGVFLAGLELMITAVALPSILDDLADATGGSAWIELRKASWIINGYLLVYILVMPLAGRLTDLWGARRPFMAALAIFIVGSMLAGLAQSLDQLIAARLVQALGGGVLVPGRDGRRRPPVRRPRPAAGARRHRRADLPGHGRRAVRRGGDPLVGPRGGRPRRRGPRRIVVGPARAGLALGLLRERADRPGRAHPGVGRVGGLGHAEASGSRRRRRRASCSGPPCSPAWWA